MTVQFIVEEGQPRFAVLPVAEYQRLVEAAEMLDDIRAYDEAKARNEEALPIEVADRILAGKSAVRVFREYRGLTQQALADRCGISKPYLSQIEAGQRTPSTEVLKKLAAALEVEIDDLV